MADPASFFASIFGAVLKFWERSLAFFLAVAIACLLLAVAAFVSLMLGFNAVSPSWVKWFVFGAIIFGVATFARLIEDIKNPPFYLIADEQISSWHRAPKADGNPGVHTRLVLHFRVTNNRRNPLLLLKAKLLRPRPWGTRTETQLATFAGWHGTYDSQHFVQARATTKAFVQITLHRDIGSEKQDIMCVLQVRNQRGARQRVRFNRLKRI